MKIEIIAIGNEVVFGDILNSNAAWLSEKLTREGFQVIRHTTVADDEERITQCLLQAKMDAQAVLVTGGLGPTVDDFTLEVAAKTFGLEMEYHPDVLDQLRLYYKARNRTMTPNQEKQAWVPKGSEIFFNPVGSAPGVHVENQGVHFFFFPGVPKEMKEIFDQSVFPWLKLHRVAQGYYASRVLRCFGTEEATLDNLVQPLLKDRVQLGSAKLAFRLKFPDIFLKLTLSRETEVQAQAELDTALSCLKSAIGAYVYGEDEETLEEVVGKLLLQKNRKLALAESCTGGLTAHRMTNIPGSSRYFLGGVVAYDNTIKQKLLGVSEKSLKDSGAVSGEVAKEMAIGVRERLGSDIGVGITGIAGPSGDTPGKPVGTVHIALATDRGCEEKKFFLPFERERFKLLVSSVALNWIRKELLEI